MKKIFALLLAAVMCLSLSACFVKNNDKEILGKWQSLDGGILEFFEDGTVNRRGDVLNWWYDKDTEKYFISDGDDTASFKIKFFESRHFFTIDGEHFYSADTFNMVYWGFMQEKIASLTEGKTELVSGGTYTTADGVKFVLEKVEISHSESNHAFDLYITHTADIKIEQANYEATFSGWKSIDFAKVDSKTAGDTYCYSGGDLDMEDIENDKNYFGILSLTINGSECYVDINTFFK